uniref:Uncharacterized protein n=1 Tax=uncultured Desulfobacterium sp. TaxID=201089 RepID=E1YCV5_9BACT|nr:unknown protein [uncultured Desulfobacterium sp.]
MRRFIVGVGAGQNADKEAVRTAEKPAEVINIIRELKLI